MFKVDVFIPRPRPFQQSQFSRAQRQTFELEAEISANFASAEDTILSKLEWYRMGGQIICFHPIPFSPSPELTLGRVFFFL
jgi:hypothetical protein